VSECKAKAACLDDPVGWVERSDAAAKRNPTVFQNNVALKIPDKYITITCDLSKARLLRIAPTQLTRNDKLAGAARPAI